MSIKSDFEKRTGLVVAAKGCRFCGIDEPLFAPFDEGKKEFCSDCQMEAENEMNENEEFDTLQD